LILLAKDSLDNGKNLHYHTCQYLILNLISIFIINFAKSSG